MDVEVYKQNGVRCRRNLKDFNYPTAKNSFSIETYFVWFSALIFITELITDLLLVAYYFHAFEMLWGLITLSIILIPLILCQFCSLLMFRLQKIEGITLTAHLLLMAIPYRYHCILRQVEKDEMIQDIESIRNMIRDLSNLQMINAIFQYCPQFIFQAFLIVFKKYKCIITGVSAGLACFSFLWHVVIRFYYFVKSFHPDLNESERIIDNLTVQMRDAQNLPTKTDDLGKNCETTKLTENFKNFEKPMYKTDDNNLMSKTQTLKNVEKSKLFDFTKRRTVYQTNHLDFGDYSSVSTIFFEINESSDSFKKASAASQDERPEDFNNENNSNLSITNVLERNAESAAKSNDIVSGTPETEVLKRKAICSSQEMLHLIDIMNDIPPEQIDILAKSLFEIDSDESLKAVDNSSDNSKLLEKFPGFIDAKLMENIETVIYENQMIFQEQIRKNQLTIQNLKMQDQLLSKYIDSLKNLTSNELFSIRDYENMCFANVSRQSRLKHWRNYLQDIDARIHDNSTVQNSSFYVNTMSNSLTDLYVNGTDIASAIADECKFYDQASIPSDAFNTKRNMNTSIVNNETFSMDKKDNEIFYGNTRSSGLTFPRKNILVETISAINAYTPVRNPVKKSIPLKNSTATNSAANKAPILNSNFSRK